MSGSEDFWELKVWGVGSGALWGSRVQGTGRAHASSGKGEIDALSAAYMSYGKHQWTWVPHWRIF